MLAVETTRGYRFPVDLWRPGGAVVSLNKSPDIKLQAATGSFQAEQAGGLQVRFRYDTM